VNAWAALVSVIEHGYSDDIYEYSNDLYCRNWLHEAWLLLDEHIVLLWTPQIKALDDRYKAATVDDDGQALDQFHRLPGPDLWWWRRHPRILIGTSRVRFARPVPSAPNLTQHDPQPRGVTGQPLVLQSQLWGLTSAFVVAAASACLTEPSPP
jgi:hypothetical protein